MSAPKTAAGLDTDQLARACADAMWADDKASRGLGMEIVEVGPGRAVIAMTVREEMVNGHGICHGGFVFTLADSAFAFACNSGNQNTVGAACTVDYLRPAFSGDVLTAEAEQRSRSGRTGVYDVTVRNQNDETIVIFRGRSHQVRGEVLEVMAS